MVNKNYIFVVGLFLLVVVNLGFVIAVHTTSPSSVSVNQGLYKVYNITLNNTNTGIDGNITQVNITLPSGFIFVLSSNGTSNLTGVRLFGTFENSSATNVLSWSNLTNMLINGSVNNSHFWFNASASSIPGNYNISIKSVNGTAVVFETNLTVTVNDTLAPGVVVSYPSNSSNYSRSTMEFNLSISDNVNVSSCWVTLDGGITNYTMTLNSTLTGANYTNSSIKYGVYTDTRFYCNDSAGNVNGTSVVTFTLETRPPTINVTAGTGSATIYNITLANSIFFNVSSLNISTIQVGTIKIYLYNTTAPVNSSNSTTSPLFINFTGLREGIYYINATVNDTIGNLNYTAATRIVYIDNNTPVISLISPNDSSSTTEKTFAFAFTVLDYSPTNCSLYLDGVLTNFNSSVDIFNGRNYLTNTTTYVGDHSWYVSCTDSLGNTNSSAVYKFTDTVAAATTTVGGGGGTVPYWTATYDMDSSELSAGGVSKELYASQRIKLKVSGETHYVGIKGISGNSVSIEINSTPQAATLGIGESKKFELTGDNYYDLLVKIEGINNSRVNVSMTSIREYFAPVSGSTTTTTQTTNGATGGQPIGEGIVGNNDWWNESWVWMVVLVIIVVIVAVVVYMSQWKKKNPFHAFY